MLGIKAQKPGASETYRPKGSTNIESVEWNAKSLELQVAFKNGARHVFNQVPKRVLDEMRKAPSAGSFFSSKIKGHYVGRRLGSQ